MKVSELLLAAKDQILDRGWTKKVERNAKGQVCLRGAIKAAARGEGLDLRTFPVTNAYRLLNRLVRGAKEKFYYSFEGYNDYYQTTKADVLGLLDEAAAVAKEDEQSV